MSKHRSPETRRTRSQRSCAPRHRAPQPQGQVGRRAASASAVAGLIAASALTAAPAGQAQTVATGDPTPGKVAYLHGNQQSQILCSGGALVGHIDTAIVDPIVASGNQPAGSCNLADMKAANPGVKFYAYLNVGATSEASQWTRNPFHSTCVPLNQGGDAYTVRTSNPNVAKDSQGRAVYPYFSFLRMTSLSPAYNDACATRAAQMVTTDSVAGTTGAAPTRFDGVFLDDMAMSPAQGQDMDQVGTWGPWGSDEGYGRAMLQTVSTINDRVAAAAPGAKVAGNLGVDSYEQGQRVLATELGASRDLDWTFREGTLGGSNGGQWGPAYIADQNGSLMNAVAQAGTPVVMNQYAVHATTDPTRNYEVGGSCLLDSTPDKDAIHARVESRRAHDQSLALGTTLLNREQGAVMQNAVSQAETRCQQTRTSGQANYETIFGASLDEDRPETQDLRYAVNWKDLHAVGEKQKYEGGFVYSRKLSDGRRIWVNYLDRDVTINGMHVPARTSQLQS